MNRADRRRELRKLRKLQKKAKVLPLAKRVPSHIENFEYKESIQLLPFNSCYVFAATSKQAKKEDFLPCHYLASDEYDICQNGFSIPSGRFIDLKTQEWIDDVRSWIPVYKKDLDTTVLFNRLHFNGLPYWKESQYAPRKEVHLEKPFIPQNMKVDIVYDKETYDFLREKYKDTFFLP